MRGIVKHLDSLDSVWLQRAMEEQETRELKITLNIFSAELVNLSNPLRQPKIRSNVALPPYLILLNIVCPSVS